MLKENFVKYFEDSIRKNWDYPALTDYNGESFRYFETGMCILRLHKLFREAGIKEDDKIALVGKNSARWGILYISIVSFGAVAVPILPDFKSDDLHEIIVHSDSILLFVDDTIYEKLDQSKMPALQGVISLNTFNLLVSRIENLENILDNCKLNKSTELRDAERENFKLPEIPNDRLAVISYTSGTTGFTKGVMLPHNSLAANIRFAQLNMPLNAGDRIVSFLPLAHTFGCAFEFLFPFTLGCDITILTKTPSPQIIMKAFEEIRPSLILSVPLVIEKIYKKQIMPLVSKTHMKILLRIPGINQIIFKKIRAKLTIVFGGNFRELVIGGAPLNKEAESFFKKIKFPFTVGYGMTECGPLISYVKWSEFLKDSSGRVVDTLEMKINSIRPERIAGEILVKGENVMYGYYKNQEATDHILDERGWLHTGDLGLLDKNNNVFIKGRNKSMILGPNGKNIYPEEIESLFNNKYAVAESLVVERKGKLIAIIYPDQEVLEKENISKEDIPMIMDQHLKAVNQKLPGYINVSSLEILDKEFIKTPKRSIKRFLYK